MTLEDPFESDPRVRELRALLDQARLDSQRLHLLLHEKESAETLRGRLRTDARRLWRATRGLAGAFQRGLLKRSPGDRGRRGAASREPAPKPYRVRAPHPAAPHRPRVLHAVGNFAIGGSARLIVDLVEHLGHEFEQSVMLRDRPDPLPYEGVPLVHEAHTGDPERFLTHLRRLKPDVLHVHFLGHHRTPYSERDWRWYSSVFQAAEAFGCPVVENVNIPTDPYVSPCVACYVYVSDYVRRLFGRMEGRHITVYPGSDLALFSRRAGATPPDDTVGMVYRLERDKLDDGAIDVFVRVLRQRPQTKVLIVGGGALLEHYKAIVRHAGLEGAVCFTGYVPYEELPALYGGMSVFVAPVHRESFGQVSAFAMGMGIPVVGFAVGALPEIVGSAELLARPNDPDALARVIVALLDDRERRLEIGAANVRTAHAKFSVQTMAAAYSSLYGEILGARRRPR